MDYSKGIEEGRQALASGKFDEALRIFERLRNRFPEMENEAMYYKGMVELKRGLYAESEKIFREIIERSPHFAPAWADRAVACFHLGKKQAALEDISQAILLDPDNGYFYSCRAWFRERVKDLDGAMQDYEISIRLDPDNAVTYNNLALLQQKAGYFSRAKQSGVKADELAEKIFGTASYESQTQSFLEAETASSSTESDFAAGDSPSLTFAGYWKTLQSFFTNSADRAEFFQFLKGKKLNSGR